MSEHEIKSQNSKEHIGHLRKIHFSLILVSFTLIVTILSGGLTDYEKALNQARFLKSLTRNLDPNWYYQYSVFLREKENEFQRATKKYLSATGLHGDNEIPVYVENPIGRLFIPQRSKDDLEALLVNGDKDVFNRNFPTLGNVYGKYDDKYHSFINFGFTQNYPKYLNLKEFQKFWDALGKNKDVLKIERVKYRILRTHLGMVKYMTFFYYKILIKIRIMENMFYLILVTFTSS